jgi:hypothetical protein
MCKTNTRVKSYGQNTKGSFVGFCPSFGGVSGNSSDLFFGGVSGNSSDLFQRSFGVWSLNELLRFVKEKDFE